MTPLTTHLDYYLRHGLNPVRYAMRDYGQHYERRGSLYRTLGITPLAVRGSRVLEVAPGTGQNSLYMASLGPAELTLVEPNPVAIRDITALYATPGISSITPDLVESTLQDFLPGRDFDLVICENWLGHSPHERRLLRKLGRMVSAGGALVVTTVSPVGVLPNVLRKALTCRLDNPAANFHERTALLTQAFDPHLKTISGMTRSVTDWVHDNVMNPAYFGILLTIPMVIQDLGETFDLLGSSPRFGSDWRWFKTLAGPGREFNHHFLEEYHRELHNFLDHRIVQPPRAAERNRELEAAAWVVAERVSDLESAMYSGQPMHDPAAAVVSAVQRVLASLTDLSAEWTYAMNEFLECFTDPNLTAEAVGKMDPFGSLFGRETVFISLERVR